MTHPAKHVFISLLVLKRSHNKFCAVKILKRSETVTVQYQVNPVLSNEIMEIKLEYESNMTRTLNSDVINKTFGTNVFATEEHVLGER